MKVGTFPWLLRHELRLWWRRISSIPRFRFWAILLGLFLAMILLSLWFALQELRDVILATGLPEAAIWSAIVIWCIGFFYAFIRAIDESIVALFERGDLDLLVASPLSSRVIFASRLVSVALEVFLSFCTIVVPVSLLALLAGLPQLLGVYPALIGLSLTAASLGMLVTLWLVQLLGARQARTWSQVLSSVVAALAFLGTQLPNLLRDTNVNSGAAFDRLRDHLVNAGLGANSLIWFPAKAIFFDPISVLLTLLASSGLAWLTVKILHRSFQRGVQQSVTRRNRPFRGNQGTKLASGLGRVVFYKEWRTIRRNPYLISRTSLQILFLIPFFVIVLRGSGERSLIDVATVVGMAGPLIGGQLAFALTYICVSGEEAPDLLKSAPVPGTTLRRYKLLAALIPVWILLSPVFILLIVQGRSWVPAFIVSLGGTVSAAFLRLWNSRPIQLSEIFKPGGTKQYDLLLGTLESISPLVWAGLGFSIYQGFLSVVLGLLVAIGVILALGYWRSRQIGTHLGF